MTKLTTVSSSNGFETKSNSCTIAFGKKINIRPIFCRRVSMIPVKNSKPISISKIKPNITLKAAISN